jgi:hypothetical protein
MAPPPADDRPAVVPKRRRGRASKSRAATTKTPTKAAELDTMFPRGNDL